MEFSIQTWKEKAGQKYHQLGDWIAQRKQDAGFVAYGGLTAFTLWPLVEAVITAAQAGQPLPMAAIMALGSVAGSVGGNLLAGQIQNWHDAAARGDVPTEADVMLWLSQTSITQTDLQSAVDRMLAALDALPQAEAALPPQAWTTLIQALHEDLQQLTQLPRLQAKVEGSGVIVIGDHNTTVGPGGTLVMGDQITQVLDPNQTDPAALKSAYLARLLAERNRLWLGGIDPKAATEESERLQLSAVYTALLTESSEGAHFPGIERIETAMAHEKSKLSALEQLNRHQHLVLLGDPGSGKSTFVNFVAACLAGEALADVPLGLDVLRAPLPQTDEERRRSKEEEPQPQPWDHGPLLPVVVTLRDFAARGLPKAGQKATAKHLWRFLHEELSAASLGQATKLLVKELLEKGGIFLFDGLDEVPTANEHRVHIKQVVQDVAHTFRRCRILVTSRTYAYQKQDWRLPNFQETVLAPFSKGQIEQFVDRWYAHVAAVRHVNRQDAQGRAALLKQAIFGSKRLYPLAEKPLLLTLMASLHAWRGGSLPEKREQLYSDSVDLLLDLWEQNRIVRDTDGNVSVIQPSLEQWLQVDRDKMRGLLNRLAYEAHSRQQKLVGTADIAEADLVMGLLNLSEEKDLRPAQLVEFLSNRAGLLLPRGVGVFTFPHRTFQEYLAACYLTDDDYPEKIAGLVRQDPNRWREVALLAGAKAARGSASSIWALVDALCYADVADAGDGVTDCWGAHLAGQALCEVADLAQVSPRNRMKKERVQRWLVHLLTGTTLPAVERAAAGSHLAQLGDPRPHVTDVDKMQFCYVPGGPFWMGEGEEAHELSFLRDGYWLGRYPVTHAQFMAFVSDGGYEDGQWWPEAIQAGRWKDGAYQDWHNNSRTQPYDWGRQYRLANAPVVGVSWYEAVAFTRWLTARWQTVGWLADGWQAALPSEAEWEKAARGGVKILQQPIVVGVQALATADTTLPPVDNHLPQRPFTWGDANLTPDLANYGSSEINRNSSVGAYRAAASVYGCEEMLGNVWEWTRSLKKEYPYDPADGRERLQRKSTEWTGLRGGAFHTDENSPRCGARYGSGPSSVSGYYGFRVVVSPLFADGR